MSNYKGHLFGGLIAYVSVLYLILLHMKLSFFTVMEWLLFTLLGSLFPDVDTKSKGQKLFYWIILTLIGFFVINHCFEGLAFVSTIAVLPLLGNHRGVFHTIWFVVLFPCILAYVIILQFPLYINSIICNTACFILGAISHIWLDFGFFRMLRRW